MAKKGFRVAVLVSTALESRRLQLFLLTRSKPIISMSKLPDRLRLILLRVCLSHDLTIGPALECMELPELAVSDSRATISSSWHPSDGKLPLSLAVELG